jgi:two-component system chemotaxis response regulator CheY
MPLRVSAVRNFRRLAQRDAPTFCRGSPESFNVHPVRIRWLSRRGLGLNNEANEANAARDNQGASSSRSFCVLLAEDNSFVSELFRYAVVRFQKELTGYASHDLLTAVTGQEALRLLQKRRADIVIVDHYLPGLTGCALVRRLRAMPDYEQTPILVISVGGAEIRQEAIEAGATHFMDKPVQLSQLLDTMRSFTSKEDACQ